MSQIEPPLRIKSNTGKEKAIANCVNGIMEMQRIDPLKPVIGLIFVHLNTGKDAEDFYAKLQLCMNHYWMEVMGHTTPLEFMAVAKQNTPNILDIFFANDIETVRNVAKCRYKGNPLNL